MLLNSYPEVVKEHIAIQRKSLDFLNGTGGQQLVWSTRGAKHPTNAQKRKVVTIPMVAFASPASNPNRNYASKLANNKNEIPGMSPALRVVNLQQTGLLSYLSERQAQEWSPLTALENGFKPLDKKKKLWTFQSKDSFSHQFWLINTRTQRGFQLSHHCESLKPSNLDTPSVHFIYFDYIQSLPNELLSAYMSNILGRKVSTKLPSSAKFIPISLELEHIVRIINLVFLQQCVHFRDSFLEKIQPIIYRNKTFQIAWRIGQRLKASSLTNYLSHIKQLAIEVYPRGTEKPIHKLLEDLCLFDDLKPNQALLENITGFFQKRALTKSQSSVLGDISALSFFLKILRDQTLNAFSPAIYTFAKDAIKRLGLGKNQGSDCLTWKQIRCLWKHSASFSWKDSQGSFDSNSIQNLIMISTYACLRIGSVKWIQYTGATTLSENKDSITIIIPDAKNCYARDDIQSVILGSLARSKFCPIKAFRKLQSNQTDPRFLIVDSNSNGLHTNRLSRLFAKFIKYLKVKVPSLKKKKITWHSLRISAISYYSTDLGAPNWVVRLFSRHKTDHCLDAIYKRKGHIMRQKTQAKVMATVMSGGSNYPQKRKLQKLASKPKKRRKRKERTRPIATVRTPVVIPELSVDIISDLKITSKPKR